MWIFQRKFINPSFEVNTKLQEKVKPFVITEDNSQIRIEENSNFYKYLKISPVELIKSNWQNTIDVARINKLFEF